MPLRLLHTSDWHLGHTLHDLPREVEHRAFLDWLLARLEAEAVDALIVAGDIFDVANPSAAAQHQLYAFLATVRRRLPHLGIVVIGGNHDSAARLDAPDPFLRVLDVRVVGGLPRGRDRALDTDRFLIPLKDRTGAVAAWVVAVPFLRPSDLDPVEQDGVDALVEGVRRVYADAFAAARSKREPGQALVATGHAYMTGTQLSELSERKVLGGNQHALPVDVFPEDACYVALGHLHLAQTVGRESVRYSGSPIPLSMTEASYPHQVLLVDLDGDRFVAARPLLIPRTVELLRVPAAGPAPLDAVLDQLSRLAPRAATPEERRPFLEVQALLEEQDPKAKARIELACEGKEARLVHVTLTRTGHGGGLADVVGTAEDLRPKDVLRILYTRDFKSDPPQDLLEAFDTLLELVEQEDGP